jgi:hypothetical protein
MHQIKIMTIDGQILEKRHFMIKPNESQKQTFWVESLKKFGALIVFQYEIVRYADLT